MQSLVGKSTGQQLMKQQLRASSPRALQPSVVAHVNEPLMGSRWCRRSLSHTMGENKRMRRKVLASAASVAPGKAPPREQVFTSDPANNVSDYVYEKMGMVLHQQKDHPIAIIKQVSVEAPACTGIKKGQHRLLLYTPYILSTLKSNGERAQHMNVWLIWPRKLNECAHPLHT
eukprot:1159133-Pelagomonas_calceolata.AAC.1